MSWSSLRRRTSELNKLERLAAATIVNAAKLRDEIAAIRRRGYAAASVLDARSVAAAPRVRRLQLGEADLRAELAIEASTDDRELLYLRSHIVLCSAAAGIDPPLSPACVNFRDMDAYEASTRALRQLGFFGQACIHPVQVPVTNVVFTPTEEEVAAARQVLNGLREAGGGAVAHGGHTHR